MIDPFIIEYIKKKQKEKRRERAGIPLYIDPPEQDGYGEDSAKKDGDKKGYIEIDIFGEDEDSNTIKI